MYDAKLQLELAKLLYALYVHTYIHMLHDKRNMAMDSGYDGHLLSQMSLWPKCPVFFIGTTVHGLGKLVLMNSCTDSSALKV